MKFLSELKLKNKKRFSLEELEKHLIVSYKGNTNYLANGGYVELYNQINTLKANNNIKEIKSSNYNGLNPPLKTKWEIISNEEVTKWDKSKILQLSDLLDFSYYVNNPKNQTDLEWEYIQNIYGFLKSRDNREWASIEERSLELFYDEKFLTIRKETLKGKYGILPRLKLSYDDLKMKRYGEMFLYWNRGTKYIKNIIILENHSTFFSYKRMAEKNKSIFGFYPDIIIYGEGKKIENSFSFIEEIADISKIKVRYFGDIDSEGFGIYFRLKDRYPNVDIRLHCEAYRDLISISSRYYPLDGQQKKQIYLDCFVDEMDSYLDKEQINKLLYIWDNDFRIPQELIDYEYLLKVKR